MTAPAPKMVDASQERQGGMVVCFAFEINREIFGGERGMRLTE